MMPTEHTGRARMSLLRDAVLWALFAALLIEFGINLVFDRTLWHRISATETTLQEIQLELAHCPGAK